MFPDRKLFGEDVIGSEYENGTFYSSHRILSTASHLGKGFYGSPTGSKLTYRVIADCICRENKVIDEDLMTVPLRLSISKTNKKTR